MMNINYEPLKWLAVAVLVFLYFWKKNRSKAELPAAEAGENSKPKALTPQAFKRRLLKKEICLYVVLYVVIILIAISKVEALFPKSVTQEVLLVSVSAVIALFVSVLITMAKSYLFNPNGPKIPLKSQALINFKFQTSHMKPIFISNVQDKIKSSSLLWILDSIYYMMRICLAVCAFYFAIPAAALIVDIGIATYLPALNASRDVAEKTHATTVNTAFNDAVKTDAEAQATLASLYDQKVGFDITRVMMLGNQLLPDAAVNSACLTLGLGRVDSEKALSNMSRETEKLFAQRPQVGLPDKVTTDNVASLEAAKWRILPTATFATTSSYSNIVARINNTKKEHSCNVDAITKVVDAALDAMSSKAELANKSIDAIVKSLNTPPKPDVLSVYKKLYPIFLFNFFLLTAGLVGISKFMARSAYNAAEAEIKRVAIPVQDKTSVIHSINNDYYLVFEKIELLNLGYALSLFFSKNEVTMQKTPPPDNKLDQTDVVFFRIDINGLERFGFYDFTASTNPESNTAHDASDANKTS